MSGTEDIATTSDDDPFAAAFLEVPESAVTVSAKFEAPVSGGQSGMPKVWFCSWSVSYATPAYATVGASSIV